MPASRRRAKASPPAPIDLNPRTEAALDFSDRPLGTLTPDDYAELGFLCGLEVHQQLLTRRKLFCRCPAGRRARQVDAEVLRHMRPTLSEMGQYDGTALMEFKTRKEIVYQLDRSCVCTYEIDDTPPFEIDTEAVRIALEVSRLFDLQLVSELAVMRKQYLDGSIPTGFQRTAMVGIGGSIPFRGAECGDVLRIRQLTLEEDSCREVSDVGHRVTFQTDRLGMPLIETVTEPDFLTPNDVRTGARLLSAVVRASGKVRRGAGAARQDVNVSIAGSRRVEIKGVCHQRGLPQLVHNEAFRHLNLLRVRAELARRGVQPADLAYDDIESPFDSGWAVDARPLVPGSGVPALHAAVERDAFVGAVRLPGFVGLLAHRTQPGTRFADELADRVRVIACLIARPFMVTSDDGVGHAVFWRELRRALKASDDEAVVLLFGPQEDVDCGLREVLLRAQEAFVGVPSETRQARRNGTTGFERILPGAERMYPDTDTPPLPIPDAWIEVIEAAPTERPWERADRYRAHGLPDALCARLATAPWARLFEALLPRTGANCDLATRLGYALEKRLPRDARYAVAPVNRVSQADLGHPVERLDQLDPGPLLPLIDAAARGTVRLEALEPAIERLFAEPAAAPEAVVAAFASGPSVEAELRGRVAALAQDASSLRSSDPDARLRWAMGRVAAGYAGRFVAEALRESVVDALGRVERGPEEVR